MPDFQIPQGATPVDPNRLVSAPSSHDFQIPKGATPLGGNPSQSTSITQAKKTPSPVSLATPSKTGIQYSRPPGEVHLGQTDSHVDKLMGYIRETAERRQQVYDYTVGSGYTKDQAQKRQQEYDYAIKNGMNPQRAQEFALGMQFEGGTP